LSVTTCETGIEKEVSLWKVRARAREKGKRKKRKKKKRK
jgi:hypothetical protein